MLILKFKQVKLSANQHQSVFLYVAFTRVGPKGDKGLSVYETTEGVFYCYRKTRNNEAPGFVHFCSYLSCLPKPKHPV